MGKVLQALQAYEQEVARVAGLIQSKLTERNQIMKQKEILDKAVDDALNKAIAVDGEVRALQSMHKHLEDKRQALWQEKQAQKEARKVSKAKRR